MSLAEEMGWQEITHDEDMNYYFGRGCCRFSDGLPDIAECKHFNS